jgi:hypothetical protein
LGNWKAAVMADAASRTGLLESAVLEPSAVQSPAVGWLALEGGRSYRLKDHAVIAGKEDTNKQIKSKSNEPSTAEPAS